MVCNLLRWVRIQQSGQNAKGISMVLPKHPQSDCFQRGPLFRGGDPAKTLWVYPLMRGVDKVNPNSTVGRSIYNLYSFE